MGIFNGKTKDGKLKTMLVYESGIANFTKKQSVNVVLDEESNKLMFDVFGRKELTSSLDISKITSIGFVTDEYIKESNKIGRAIAGGILFGSTGAIVGAVTGKDKKKKKNYFAITYTSNNEENVILFEPNGYTFLVKIINKIKELQPELDNQKSNLEL